MRAARGSGLVATVAAAVLAAGVVVAANGHNGSGAETPAAVHETTVPVPRPALAIAGTTGTTGTTRTTGTTGTTGTIGTTVVPGRPLTLRVTNGRVVSLAVTGTSGTLSGRLDTNRTTWRSTALVVPGDRYAVTAVLADARAQRHPATLTLLGGRAKSMTYTRIAPLADGTYGVGEPIRVWFTRPVHNKAAVERALAVHASAPVEGSWRWFGDSEIHWRPAHYWPAHTKVTLDVRLHAVQLSPGSWGTDRSVSFDIGSALVSTVDVPAHSMTVTEDGRVVRTLRVSTGSDKYPTLGGVHVVLEKLPKLVMDSSTVGIPKSNPDYYRETVLWDVRISNGGAFVHSAPWSVSDQGSRNVSHGCVNLSPEDAEWYFKLAEVGDIVNVVGATIGPNTADPGMSECNMSYDQWRSGSALAS